MEAIIYNGQRVITTELLAMAYETDPKNIRSNFGNNKSKFIEGKHFFYLDGDLLREFKNHTFDMGVVESKASKLYLWTERGANHHCKILDTDKAWEQFDNLEETYFKVKEGMLAAPCEVKYLSSSANYLRIQRQIMRDQGSTPQEIARMSQSVCTQYGIRLPEGFVVRLPYEQMALEVYNGK